MWSRVARLSGAGALRLAAWPSTGPVTGCSRKYWVSWRSLAAAVSLEVSPCSMVSPSPVVRPGAHGRPYWVRGVRRRPDVVTPGDSGRLILACAGLELNALRQTIYRLLQGWVMAP